MIEEEAEDIVQSDSDVVESFVESSLQDSLSVSDTAARPSEGNFIQYNARNIRVLTEKTKPVKGHERRLSNVSEPNKH